MKSKKLCNSERDRGMDCELAKETVSGSLRESARTKVRVNEKEVPSYLVRVRARLELRKE